MQHRKPPFFPEFMGRYWDAQKNRQFRKRPNLMQKEVEGFRLFASGLFLFQKI
jgi:hypothetical protein